MFGSLFNRLRPLPAAAPFAPLRPFYAIGDVHGRADLLDEMLTRIPADAAALGLSDPAIIFLGDYVDRGEDSAGVIATIRKRVIETPDQYVALKGNHEAMMLAWLADPVKERRWLQYGGLQTLASYGVGGLTERAGPDQLLEAADALSAAMPEGEEQWLNDLPTLWQSGNMACVHAGADPDLPIEDQKPSTLIWGHRAFMQRARRDDIWVIHGHTVTDNPEVIDSRIAVDTGAYFSGRLTACRVTPAGEQGFIDVRA